MRKWVVWIGIVLLLLVGAYFALSFYAVKLIQSQLQKAIGPGITVAEINVRPTYLCMKDIRYADPTSQQPFANIEEIRFYPDLLSSLKGSLHLREWLILRPAFFFQRSRDGGWTGPWMAVRKPEESKEKPPPGEKKEERPSIQIEIDRFRLQEGSIAFEDRKVEGTAAQIHLRELNMRLENLHYPLRSAQSPIEVEGKLKGKAKDGILQLKGWIDLETGDTESSFKISGWEVKAFEPYYRKRVTAEIESGQIDIESMIAVKGKRIDAPGQLELIDLRIKEGEGTVIWIPAKALVSLLKKKGDRVKVKFHVQGHLDDPKFNLQEHFLTRAVISLAEELGIPIKVVGEKTLGGTLMGTEGLIKGLKSVEELFKKKKEKKR